MESQLKEQVNLGTALPLMEAFYTLQGEGYHKGVRLILFVLGGCDVGCHWCDVKESWDAEKHPPTNIDQYSDRSKKIF